MTLKKTVHKEKRCVCEPFGHNSADFFWQERRAGQLLREMKENEERATGHGDQKSESRHVTPKVQLADLGISKKQSSDRQSERSEGRRPSKQPLTMYKIVLRLRPAPRKPPRCAACARNAPTCTRKWCKFLVESANATRNLLNLQFGSRSGNQRCPCQARKIASTRRQERFQPRRPVAPRPQLHPTRSHRQTSQPAFQSQHRQNHHGLAAAT